MMSGVTLGLLHVCPTFVDQAPRIGILWFFPDHVDLELH